MALSRGTMKTEIQTIEQALGEVVATRQQLDGIADQLRAAISSLRVEARIADRAKLAADERVAQTREAVERAAQLQREQQEADHKAAEKAAVARAALDRLLLDVFKPLVDSGVELARQHLGRKSQRRQPSQQRKTKPATKAARPSGQG